ncbi:MAG TPA: peptidylprolyl isomerase [Terriglobales bacterium]|jgi:peptidyl-prolyl cis-trans isomerase A (cyclophilin A)|nr:peptidylprolyl isomerase [Terriglobales bacterium]
MGRRIAYLLLCCSLTAWGQTAKTPPAPSGPPTAVLHTTAGDMRCVLLPGPAPKTVDNFIGLATGRKDWANPVTGKRVHGKPLYDGVIFHRVIPSFMIQGGDPSGTGSGDVGFTFNDELHPDLLFDQPGRLAMANRGPNSNSSQFFITEVAVPALNPCLEAGGCRRGSRVVSQGTGYTIFGQCDDATVELVKKIARMPCQGGMACTGANSRLEQPVTITHIEILNDPGAPSAAPKRSTKSRK